MFARVRDGFLRDPKDVPSGPWWQKTALEVDVDVDRMVRSARLDGEPGQVTLVGLRAMGLVVVAQVAENSTQLGQ